MDRLFRRRPSLTARAALAALACVAVLVLERRSEQMEVVRAGLLTAVAPLQQAVDAPFRAGSWVADRARLTAELRARSDRLEAENRALRLRLMTLAALELENERLAALLDSVQERRVPGRFLVARMMAVGLDPYAGQVQLSRGARHGVYPGQPVLDARGVLGQVTHVAAYTSQALLVTDPRAAVPVKSVRSGVRAIAVGTGPVGELALPYLPAHVDLDVGDILVTSGLDGTFPADYPVARVIEVARDSGDEFARVRAQPLGYTDRIQEVLLVWPKPARAHAAAPAPAATAPDADG
jgi:rod shape-determining protein MreC